MFTAALALFLLVIFGIEKRFAFDFDRDGSLSVDSLVAFGAASYDLVVLGHEWWRVFLAPLLHLSFGHLAGNCFALALAGFLIEARMGRGWYAAIFAFSALTGVAGSLIGNAHGVPTVGAAGAITGLIAALFAVSFHNGCDPVEREAMQRMATRLGVPALGPLLYQASSGVDYAAHLGGAVGGGLLALVVTTVWAGNSFRPPFAARAAGAALLGLLLSAGSLYFVVSQFSARAAAASERIPAKSLPTDLNKGAKVSADLVARYPKDPRGHFFRGRAFATQRQLGAAEAELRKAISLATRPYDIGIRSLSRTYLALVVLERGGRAEAAQLAKEGCASRETEELKRMLRRAMLCN